eukprot:764296-Hanusia_phi.AAC.2
MLNDKAKKVLIQRILEQQPHLSSSVVLENSNFTIQELQEIAKGNFAGYLRDMLEVTASEQLEKVEGVVLHDPLGEEEKIKKIKIAETSREAVKQLQRDLGITDYDPMFSNYADQEAQNKNSLLAPKALEVVSMHEDELTVRWTVPASPGFDAAEYMQSITHYQFMIDGIAQQQVPLQVNKRQKRVFQARIKLGLGSHRLKLRVMSDLKEKRWTEWSTEMMVEGPDEKQNRQKKLTDYLKHRDEEEGAKVEELFQSVRKKNESFGKLAAEEKRSGPSKSADKAVKELMRSPFVLLRNSQTTLGRNEAPLQTSIELKLGENYIVLDPDSPSTSSVLVHAYLKRLLLKNLSPDVIRVRNGLSWDVKELRKDKLLALEEGDEVEMVGRRVSYTVAKQASNVLTEVKRKSKLPREIKSFKHETTEIALTVKHPLQQFVSKSIVGRAHQMRFLKVELAEVLQISSDLIEVTSFDPSPPPAAHTIITVSILTSEEQQGDSNRHGMGAMHPKAIVAELARQIVDEDSALHRVMTSAMRCAQVLTLPAEFAAGRRDLRQAQESGGGSEGTASTLSDPESEESVHEQEELSQQGGGRGEEGRTNMLLQEDKKASPVSGLMSKDHPLKTVEGRLATFYAWQGKGRAADPLALARQGFYHIPDPDNFDVVRCAFCRMELANLNSLLVDVAKLHAKGSPSCVMVRKLDKKDGEEETRAEEENEGVALISSRALSPAQGAAQEKHEETGESSSYMTHDTQTADRTSDSPSHTSTPQTAELVVGSKVQTRKGEGAAPLLGRKRGGGEGTRKIAFADMEATSFRSSPAGGDEQRGMRYRRGNLSPDGSEGSSGSSRRRGRARRDPSKRRAEGVGQEASWEDMQANIFQKDMSVKSLRSIPSHNIFQRSLEWLDDQYGTISASVGVRATADFRQLEGPQLPPSSMQEFVPLEQHPKVSLAAGGTGNIKSWEYHPPKGRYAFACRSIHTFHEILTALWLHAVLHLKLKIVVAGDRSETAAAKSGRPPLKCHFVVIIVLEQQTTSALTVRAISHTVANLILTKPFDPTCKESKLVQFLVVEEVIYRPPGSQASAPSSPTILQRSLTVCPDLKHLHPCLRHSCPDKGL